ncbi:unnamed protein product [Adineta steineri]|uniref:Uncharacterized protein n=1 Tax=Adineta steineri TaxID=433720 RepID=A0A814C3V9_9BILA|nr:unnamed protein product [Adineta steineri]CAF0970715.1 unnamed protein product [Adineta steineri]
MANSCQGDLKYLTDCMFFINGYCKLNDTCCYRHCREAVEQINNCLKWPKTCRDVNCPYRHPTKTSEMVPPSSKTKSLVSIFWDIENVPIPKGQKPFDIVQRIRQKLIIERSLHEVGFSCYCNSITISESNQISLHHANVRIVHVPDRKPGACDRQIMLDLVRFERICHSPATVVLISGDIDFIGILNGLRHQAGFRVIVIHNKPAKEELKATVNEHYPWEVFTVQPAVVINDSKPIENERTSRAEQSNRTRHSSRNRSLRRRDPSPNVAARQRAIANNQDIQKFQCPECKNEYDSIQSLRQHQSAKAHQFNCPVCDEKFFTTLAQTQHQKDKNHYVLDYKCCQCNRYFAKIESLNQHQQATGHILSSSQILNQNEPIRPQTMNNDNKKDAQRIILEGIEAMKQIYLKKSLKK